MNSDQIQAQVQPAWRRHERRWKDNQYVYAVVSRRSRGISIGINLNPSKACNFDCIYCQVDRKTPPQVRKVVLAQVADELDRVLEAERNGLLYTIPPFDLMDKNRRGVRDIAFSGDGEPTAFSRFGEAVGIAADARRRFGLESAKLILITDAAYLSKPAVRMALTVLDDNNGEIWAKLDAGTEDYFRLVNRPNVSLKTIRCNILEAARIRPVVIQSLWLRFKGEPPSTHEIEAFCSRLNELLTEGGHIKAVQLYTIARDPAESYAASLTNMELDALAQLVRSRVPVPVETFYGIG